MIPEPPCIFRNTRWAAANLVILIARAVILSAAKNLEHLYGDETPPPHVRMMPANSPGQCYCTKADAVASGAHTETMHQLGPNSAGPI
jgi:hypothetical protein